MSPNKVRWIVLITSGLFLLTDQILKWQAFYHWTAPRLVFPYFGWQLFLNKGVAFGLPLSNTLTIIITLPMIGLIGYLLFFARGKTGLFYPNTFLAWSLVLAGAVSNLLDRIIYHQVIDYFLIGTALVNIGDGMIVGGLIIYLLSQRYHSKSIK